MFCCANKFGLEIVLPGSDADMLRFFPLYDSQNKKKVINICILENANFAVKYQNIQNYRAKQYFQSESETIFPLQSVNLINNKIFLFQPQGPKKQRKSHETSRKENKMKHTRNVEHIRGNYQVSTHTRPRTIATQNNCHLRQLPHRTIATMDNYHLARTIST